MRVHAMQIVDMRLEHIQQVRLIEQMTGMTPWSEEDFAAALAEPDQWGGWVALTDVAEQGSSLIGFALLTLIAPESELAKLAVHPEWQRRGIATALFEKAMCHARTRSCRVCYLEVRSRNVGAIAFYSRHGFSRCGSRKNYYRNPMDDALLMFYPINPA